MYLTYIKIAKKVASIASDGVIHGCDYAVPEWYVNPAQDLELHLAIKRESQNGFATVEDAKTWLEPAIKRIIEFVHSTPNVKKTYTKVYAKIVSADVQTESSASDIEWCIENKRKLPKIRTIGDEYPRWRNPIKGADIRITYDLKDFVANLDPKRIAELKKIHAENGRKSNPEKEMKNFDYYTDIYAHDPLMVRENAEHQKKAPDTVPFHSGMAMINELGMKDCYYFIRHVGPWYKVDKYEVGDEFAKPGEKYYHNVTTEHWDVDVNRKWRWLASENTPESIAKELGVELIDVDFLEPWDSNFHRGLLLHIPEMYRFLKYLKVIPECIKYKR